VFAGRPGPYRIFAALALAASVMGGPAHACEVVCVQSSNPEMYLGFDRVFVARVAAAVKKEGRTTFTLKPIRWWTGKSSRVSLYTYGGCGMPLSLGAVYFFALGESEDELHVCSTVGGVWERWAQEAITRLDRRRGFHPLTLPSQDLRQP
jgi:hypothetical protein